MDDLTGRERLVVIDNVIVFKMIKLKCELKSKKTILFGNVKLEELDLHVGGSVIPLSINYHEEKNKIVISEKIGQICHFSNNCVLDMFYSLTSSDIVLLLKFQYCREYEYDWDFPQFDDDCTIMNSILGYAIMSKNLPLTKWAILHGANHLEESMYDNIYAQNEGYIINDSINCLELAIIHSNIPLINYLLNLPRPTSNLINTYHIPVIHGIHESIARKKYGRALYLIQWGIMPSLNSPHHNIFQLAIEGMTNFGGPNFMACFYVMTHYDILADYPSMYNTALRFLRLIDQPVESVIKDLKNLHFARCVIIGIKNINNGQWTRVIFKGFLSIMRKYFGSKKEPSNIYPDLKSFGHQNIQDYEDRLTGSELETLYLRSNLVHVRNNPQDSRTIGIIRNMIRRRDGLVMFQKWIMGACIQLAICKQENGEWSDQRTYQFLHIMKIHFNENEVKFDIANLDIN